MNSSRKIPQLIALLASLCLCAAALLTAPAGAGAWSVNLAAFSHKSGRGKHSVGQRCRGRATKSHRGCRGHGKRMASHPAKPATPAAIAAAPSPGPKPAEDRPASPGRPTADTEAPADAEAPGEAEGEEAEAEGEWEEAESEGETELETEGEEAESEAEEAEGEEGPVVKTSALAAPTGALRWAPPTLVEPKTITLGTGYTHTTLPTNRDYIIKLPPTKKVGGTWIDGGHNVVIVGGYITVPRTSFSAATNEATALSIKGATGTVHVEGVLIDGSGGGEFDAVTVNAPEAIVQLENLRIVGVRGCNENIHADVVQPWGGVKDLRINRLTGRSKCQGLTIKPDLGAIGSAQIDEVDLTALKEENVTRGGHMLWLTRGMTTCEAYPMTMSNLYVTPLPGKSLGSAVWPQGNFSGGCPASGSKSFLGWPALPLSGGVYSGAPSTGSFVPAGVAGLSYQSPGYQAG